MSEPIASDGKRAWSPTDVDPARIIVLPPGKRPHKNTAQFGPKHRTHRKPTSIRDNILGVAGSIEVTSRGHVGYVKDPTGTIAGNNIDNGNY